MLTRPCKTISCLLIQPNPDSALNATAGHLLQDDYDSFARQAKLMTSIHAGIPSDLRGATFAARRRGEEPGTIVRDDADHRPAIKAKSTSSSGVVMKKLPHRLTSTQSVPVPQCELQDDRGSASEEEDEKSASKENDPMLSPSPVPAQNPRRPTLTKRPLSDLPTPMESDCEGSEACLSPSDRNILNNAVSVTADTVTDTFCNGPQLAERGHAVNFTGRGLQDATLNGLAALPSEEKATGDFVRPVKRLCSDESKENMAEERPVEKLPERPVPIVTNTSKMNTSTSRTVSAPSTLGVGSNKGKARVGLRRL